MSTSTATITSNGSVISPQKRGSSKNHRSQTTYTSSQPELFTPEHRPHPPRTASDNVVYSKSAPPKVHDSPNGARHTDTEDNEDPHDLSISRHIPRASMVDKMALSLDNFPGGNHSPTGLKSRYHPPHSYLRKRGHTFSSSMSSEVDLREGKTSISPVRSSVRTLRRNSARAMSSSNTTPNATTKSKITPGTRHDQTFSTYQLHNSAGVKNNNSGNSSIDLGHLASLKLGAQGNRRSQSFDYDVQKRLTHMFTHAENQDLVSKAQDLIIHQDSTTGSLSESSRTKRQSTHPNRDFNGGSLQPEALGEIDVNCRSLEESVPGPAVVHHGSIGHASVQKAPPKVVPDPVPTVRPNFFRRVFGSSKIPVSIAESNPHHLNLNHNGLPDRPISVREGSIRPTTPPPKNSKQIQRPNDQQSNKENHQPTKKPSTFFRRRKKSVPQNHPPQIPATFVSDRAVEGEVPGETSPVSSLRAFMDPYLAGSLAVNHKHHPSLHGPASQIPVLKPTFGNLQSTTDASGAITRAFHESNRTAATHERAETPLPSTTVLAPRELSTASKGAAVETPRSQVSTPSHLPTEVARDSSVRLVNESVRSSPSTVTVTLAASPTLKPDIPVRQGSRRNLVTQESQPDVDLRKQDMKTVAQEDTAANQLPPLATDTVRNDSKVSPRASASDVSIYKSAPSTPDIANQTSTDGPKYPVVHVSHPSMCGIDWSIDIQKAKQIYENGERDMESTGAAAWLGEIGSERERVRIAYMSLFDFAKRNILASLRVLCGRLTLKGETQQVDRILASFARRWCECNPNHGFKSTDVVHTICYSLLLLNTDLHLADIGQKMTKIQFIRNTMTTLRRVIRDQQHEQTLRAPTPSPGPTPTASDEGISQAGVDSDTPDVFTARRTMDRLAQESSTDVDLEDTGPLVESCYHGPLRGWENQMETVLKSFYTSISQLPLPLFGADFDNRLAAATTQLSTGTHSLRRSPSSLSHAYSDTARKRSGWDSRSLGARWMAKTRSRPRLPGVGGDFGSSKTSIDGESSIWSPSASSTWSKVSLGKTLTSMSVDSFGTETTYGDFQSSIGFANALSQAIIRDENVEAANEDGIRAAPLLEDESLELCGAPWAKEGILKHKCHLDGVDKKSKDRQWNDTFAVIERGWMRLFSFANPTKSTRSTKKAFKPGAVVGGGNWQDNAEEVWKFMLRHTIASALPPPGYSKTRPYVWALSLPNGAVHLFSAGTPDIVKEFVSAANYWSARLSKEPMMGAVSSMEYGWSDAVISRATIPVDGSELPTNSISATPRQSMQLSVRSSMDPVGSSRYKSIADRTHIHEWIPPQQTMLPSQLMEVDQLNALLSYVKSNEDELQKHNELRTPMLLAFSSRHPNSTKAMTNWEKKSSHLLREIVKFRTYIDALQSAEASKERVYKMRKEEEDARQDLALDQLQAVSITVS